VRVRLTGRVLPLRIERLISTYFLSTLKQGDGRAGAEARRCGRRYVKFDTFHPAVDKGLPVTRVVSRVTLQAILAEACARLAGDVIQNNVHIVDYEEKARPASSAAQAKAALVRLYVGGGRLRACLLGVLALDVPACAVHGASRQLNACWTSKRVVCHTYSHCRAPVSGARALCRWPAFPLPGGLLS